MSTADATGAEQAQTDAAGREYTTLVYALVLVWGCGDILSTFYAHAATGSTAIEANPIVATLLSTHPLLFVATKAVSLLCVGLLLVTYRSVVKRLPCWRLWFLAVVGAGILVVSNNLAVGLAAL